MVGRSPADCSEIDRHRPLELSKTIAIARGVLTEGRLQDAAQMIEPLLEAESGLSNGSSDLSQVALCCLLARIRLIRRGDSARAWELLKGFDSSDRREPLAPSTRAEVALWLGWIRAWQDDTLFDGARALNLLDEAANLFRSQPDPSGLGWALAGQAYAYFTIDEHRLMIQALNEVAGLQESLADPYLEAWFCHLSAAASRLSGQYTRANRLIERIEALAADLDDRLLLGRALAHRAAIGFEQGQQVDEVIALAEQAEREIVQAAATPGHSLLSAYQVHASALIRIGSLEEADRVIDAGIERMGHLAVARGYILLLRVRILRMQGRTDAAETLLDRISSAVRRQNRLLSACILREQSELQLSTGDLASANANAGDSLRYAREAGNTALELEITLLCARIALREADPVTADRLLHDAERHAEYFSLLPLAALRFRLYAELAVLSERSRDARAFYLQAMSAYSLIGDQNAAAEIQRELVGLSVRSDGASRVAERAANYVDKRTGRANHAHAERSSSRLLADNQETGPEQEFGAMIARAAVSVELVAEAWLQAAEKLARGRWLVVYRWDEGGRWSLVHRHGVPPDALVFPDPSVERICENGVDWVRLRGLPAPAFYFGMECGGDEDPACAAIEKRLSPWIPVVGLALEHAILRSSRLGDGGLDRWREVGRLSILPKDFVCTSPSMRRLVKHAQRISDGHSPVLITGESGAGLGRVARLVHEFGSHGDGKFIRFSCAQDAPDLLERILTPNVRASDDPASDARSVYLDRIDELPRNLQVRLHRFIEIGAFSPAASTHPQVSGSPRILASSTADLRKLVREGHFHEELYYRLGVVHLAVPPLRDRREEIPLLVQHFLRKLTSGAPTGASITSRAVEALVRYDWPGNVRQLRNELERLIAMAASEPHSMIDIEDLSPAIANAVSGKRTTTDLSKPAKGFALDGRGLDDILAVAEKSAIEQVLAANDGQVSATAEALGLSRQGLYKKMKRLGIDPSALQSETGSVQSITT